MRFKTSWIAVGMALAASAAVAQESRLAIRVSEDGVNWSSSVTVNHAAGDSGRVYVGYFMTYVPAAGGAVPNAFASLTFQPVFSNVRFGTDTMAAFANQGNNANGGAVDPRANYSAPGGFGRLKPWAASGPSTSQSYVVHQHAGGSGGAPSTGNFYRIARNDVTRWVGTGATSGTSAVNNFNGAGGVFASQKQTPGAADPARIAGYENLLLMVLAIDTGTVAPGVTHTILAQAPTVGMSRNATTGAREASWYANTTENAPSIKAAVVVNEATINIESCSFLQQPINQSLTFGATAAFNVSFSVPNQQYQWRRNGVALVSGGRIAGATTPNLSIASISTSDEGTYDCIVVGSCGAFASNPATLAITTCPDGWIGSATAPFGNRKVHGQAYSAANAGTLLFGGATPSNAVLGDTWLYAAGQWRQLTSSGPSPRAFLAMAPLPNGRVLLFGGQTDANSSASSQSDTWEWNGSTWTRLAVSGPSARAGHTMVLDRTRSRVVLFGGLDAAGVSRQDTWEWTGGSWVQVATSGPPASFGQASAYDPVWGETIIFGGVGNAAAETWAWNGASWRRAATGGITARYYPAMAFDENLGRIVLFGGFAGGADVMGDSYFWTGSAWAPTGIGSAPAPRWNHGLSFDRSAGTLVITAGTGYGQIPLSDWNVLSNRAQPVLQPVDPVVQHGGTATLSFSAAGSSMSYRWRRNGTPLFDAGNVSGAAYPTMTISPVGAADQGVYDCVITSPCGNLTSLPATLSCRPVISTQPLGGSFRAGQAIELAVQASAGTNPTYRWRRDGVDLSDSVVYSGSGTSRLTINADEPADGGSYSLSITNPCGTTVSAVAAVEVTCPADFNDDGGTDGQDLFEFFDAWANGASSADINFDGGTDGGDVTAFFRRWEAGC